MEMGQFEVRETVHVCAAGCRHDSGALVIRRASSLGAQIMPERSVGYDVMVCIGLERFLHRRQREEIRKNLADIGVYLSLGEISNLAWLFLVYLEELHNARSDKLRAVLKGEGGWPLHADATGEDGRGTLLVVYAGWRNWVLGSWKIPTERAEVILSCLREVVLKFGAPCAMMRDLGAGMTNAMNTLSNELEPDIRILACHSHFLRDIGKDLCSPAHVALRGLFRETKIRPKLRALARDLGLKLGAEIEQARKEVETWQAQTDFTHSIPAGQAGIATVRALAQWILDYKAASTGKDFPFARPYLDLYDRCVVGRRAVDAYLCSDSDDKKVTKVLTRLQRILDPMACDVPFSRIALRLRMRVALFDELRVALRLSPGTRQAEEATAAKLSPQQKSTELCLIRQQVEKLKASLEKRRPKRGPAIDTRNAIDTVLKHLEDHGQYLWGQEIQLPAEAGGATRMVERTNNLLENFFHGMKHAERRRSGRKNLAQDFENLPAAAALAYNLNHSDYVEIICGSLDGLADAFVQLDREKHREHLSGIQSTDSAADKPIPAALRTESASLPREDRRLVRNKGIEQRINKAAKSRAPLFPVKSPSPKILCATAE